MKVIRLAVGIFILLLFICPSVCAAPAGNPSDTELPHGEGIATLKNTIGSVKISFDGESIIERELEGASDVTSAEMEGEWYLLRFGYPMFEDRFEPYVKLGLSHLEASWTENSRFVVIKGDNEIAWGIGGRVLAYEIPEHRIKFVIDGQYRSTEPDIDDVTVNDPSRTVSASDFKINEWQIGGIVSMEFPLGSGTYRRRNRYGSKADLYSLVPYVGVAFTDCDIEGKFTHEGTIYDIGDAENDSKVMLITGCDFVTPTNTSLNIEGHFVGETSISGGATVKF